MNALRRTLTCLFLCLSASLTAQGQALTADADPAERVLRDHAAFLNELSDRRRLNTFFPNEQSAFYGVPLRYVNTTRGNLTFVRRDLVAIDRIPIVFGRVYDSSLLPGGDFGAGWRLALGESISKRSDGTLVYTDDSASELLLVPTAGGYALSRPGPSNIQSVEVKGSKLLVTHRDGWVKQFAQNQDRFQLTEIRDRHGNALTIQYRGKQLRRIKGQNGRFIAVQRDAFGRISRITDDQRRAVSYVYGPRGQLEKVIDLGGNPWRYEYDRTGRLAKVIDPRNEAVFVAGFDAAGRATRVAILGSQYAYKYAATDTFVTDDANRLTRVSHNGDGLTTSITSPNGLVSELALDPDNRVTALLHDGSPIAKFSYNRDGKVEVVARAGESSAIESRYEYDAAGRPIRIDSTGGSPVVLEYNAAGDLVRRAEADRTQEFAYGTPGNLSSVTDRGVSTSYTHNAYGQIETVKGPSGSVRLSYLPDGKLKAVEFSDGTMHEYRYNPLGFREQVERNDGSRTTYVYDVAGNLVHSEGHRHTAGGETVGQDFEINANNQPTAIRFSNGDSVNVTYDATGNPQRITTTDPEAPALEYLYDATNRLVAVQDGESVSGSYQYQDTEPDLRLQTDYRTARVASGAVRQSASLGDILSIMYARPYGGALGSPVQYDESTRSFDLMSDYGVSSPNAVALSSLRRRKLVDVDVGDVEARTTFDLPSNVIFVPAEYATTNCGINCIFNWLTATANGGTNISVPAGSSVLLSAVASPAKSCAMLLCNWYDNGTPIAFANGPIYHTIGVGTHSVDAVCECSPCDLIRAVSLLIRGTSVQPPPVGPPLKITYTAFIPLDHVRLASPLDEYFYEGDNQATYVPGVSTYRVQHTVTVRTGQGITTNPPGLSATSRVYEADFVKNIRTTGTCYRKSCPQCRNYGSPFPNTPIVYQGRCMNRSAQPLDSDTAEDMPTITAQLIDAGHYDADRNFVKIRMKGAPRIGVSPYWWSQTVSPAIDWNLTIELTLNRSTGVTTYKVTGSHDGFPFHDLRIGNTVVYTRDPIPNGNTPQSLFGSGDVTVSKQGSL